MAMGHVILKRVLRRQDHAERSPTTSRSTPTCRSWSPSTSGGRRLRPGQVPHRRRSRRRPTEGARSPRRCCSTTRAGEPVVPNGSLGHRFTASGEGHWNLDLRRRRPAAEPARGSAGRRPSRSPLTARASTPATPGVLRRGVPTRMVAGRLVTTVFDLMLAQYGGGPRRACRGSGPPATTTRPQPVHARLAGADHRGAGRRRGAGRARVRGQRRAIEAAAR